MWNVKFLSEAEADMHSLDNSLKKQILKGIAKVSTNRFRYLLDMENHLGIKAEII